MPKSNTTTQVAVEYAHKQGKMAATKGTCFTNNPYASVDNFSEPMAKAWSKGYLEAEKKPIDNRIDVV
jgi:hypothetical protein